MRFADRSGPYPHVGWSRALTAWQSRTEVPLPDFSRLEVPSLARFRLIPCSGALDAAAPRTNQAHRHRPGQARPRPPDGDPRGRRTPLGPRARPGRADRGARGRPNPKTHDRDHRAALSVPLLGLEWRAQTMRLSSAKRRDKSGSFRPALAKAGSVKHVQDDRSDADHDPYVRSQPITPRITAALPCRSGRSDARYSGRTVSRGVIGDPRIH